MKCIGILLTGLISLCYAASPCSDPGVIFCNGFEGTPQEVNVAWQTPYPGYLTAIDSGPFNVSGNKVLKLPLDAAAYTIPHALPGKYDTLYARWYQKWGTGYDWGKADHVGLSFCTGTQCQAAGWYPQGCDATYALLQSRGSGNSGGLTYYAYHPGKEATGNPWGDDIPSSSSLKAPITSGKWYCVQGMMNMGTPTPTASGANGSLNVWLDGKEYGPYSNIWMRSCNVLQLTRVLIQNYQAPGNEQPGVSAYFDDFVISTKKCSCDTRVEPGSGIQNGKAEFSMRSPGLGLSAVSVGRGVLLQYVSREAQTTVKAVLYSQAGQKVRTLMLSRRAGSENYCSAEWNRRSENGEIVRSGIYVVRIETKTRMQTSKVALVD